MKTYLGKMRGERTPRPRVGWQDACWSWLGAFTGMALICWLSAEWLSQQLSPTIIAIATAIVITIVIYVNSPSL